MLKKMVAFMKWNFRCSLIGNFWLIREFSIENLHGLFYIFTTTFPIFAWSLRRMKGQFHLIASTPECRFSVTLGILPNLSYSSLFPLTHVRFLSWDGKASSKMVIVLYPIYPEVLTF